MITAAFFFFKKFNKLFFSFIFFFQQFSYIISTELSQPLALLVGFNNIHPFFFYAAIFSFSYYILTVEKLSFIRMLSILKLSVVALLLGGYWGAGNSVWGFFWVNDSIEYILLIFCLVIVFFLHTKKHISSAFYLSVMMLFIFFMLFCFRWGLKFTRHNFLDSNVINNFIFYLTYLRFLTLFFACLVQSNLQIFLFIFIFVIIFLIIFFLDYDIDGKLLFIHVIILALCLSWLRYKPFYFSKIYLNFNIFSYTVYIYINNFNNYLYFKFFKLVYKTLYINPLVIFTTKVFLLRVVVMAYSCLIFLVFSMLCVISSRRFVLDKYKIKSK